LARSRQGFSNKASLVDCLQKNRKKCDVIVGVLASGVKPFACRKWPSIPAFAFATSSRFPQFQPFMPPPYPGRLQFNVNLWNCVTFL
jgi:hypothetical protein